MTTVALNQVSLAEALDLGCFFGDESWSAMLDQMLADADQVEVVSALCSELWREGRFREPVRFDDDGLGNGRHRMAAHIVTGIEPVWVVGAEQVVGHFHDLLVGPVDDVEAFFELVGGMSFGLDENRWVTAEGAAAVNGGAEVWVVSDEPDPDLLVEPVKAWLTAHGWLGLEAQASMNSDSME